METHFLWLAGKEPEGQGDICHAASSSDVEAAITAAQQAYESGIWSRASRHHRADVLDKCAALLADALPQLIPLESKQTGRVMREMNAQVPSLTRWFKYYASLLRVEERSVLPTVGKLHNFVDRAPLGVVVQITPFNHPLLIAVKKLAPALAAGNSVIIKPSELTPLTTLLLAKILHQAGIPDGVLSVLPGLGAVTGKALVEHPLVRKVDVTGGTEAGRAIGKIVGGNLAKYTAELGGKAPVIVFEKADIDTAVNGIVFGSFIASGQTCVAGTRIIVQSTIVDTLLEKLKAKVEGITRRMGDPSKLESSMGPLISERQLGRVERLVDQARENQLAIPLVGGKRMTGHSNTDGFDFAKGYFYEPTVLVSTSDNSIVQTSIWREEAFGPVIVVAKFDTEEEAIALANDTEFGLGAGIWTQDLSQAFRVSERIEAGITWVNTHHRNDPSSPWGGVTSASGVGSENGIEAYHAYTTTKSTIINYASPEESLASDDWFGGSEKLSVDPTQIRKPGTHGECMMSSLFIYCATLLLTAQHFIIYTVIMSPWGKKASPGEHTAPAHNDHISENTEPTEQTRLLPDNEGYLSPDDPAVSPYNLWSVRALRGVSIVALALSFIWWTFLLVSIFVSPPMIHPRGSGFFAFAYTTLATGYLVAGLLFFAVPSKPMTIWGIILAVLLLVDMIIILAVPRIRLEEGWVGIASVVWVTLISSYQVVQNRAVAWGKREEEERLTGREETRRSLIEWVVVLAETILLAFMAIAAVLFTATLILRAFDVGLEAPGQRYRVHGDAYQVHLACFGNKTAGDSEVPTILLEGGNGPVEHTLQPFIDDIYQRGSIGRYCYWDRPGFGWSDNAPSPHSAGMSADVLAEALALAGETGPWIVVSAGVGSLYSRLFASRNLLEVRGIFMIDPLHEEYLGNVGRPGRGFLLWLRGVVSPLGLDRLAGAILRGRSREDRVMGRSAYQSGKYIKAKLQESLVAVTMTAAEIQSARHVQMGHAPVVVVSSGEEVRRSSLWEERQEDLSHITDNLLAWDVAEDAPHEVWTTGQGRELLERRLKELVQKSQT
ncbi:unnamed protein product [Penicillium olsonii]|nr:unnamed protein product [Penicillium olsonii]